MRNYIADVNDLSDEELIKIMDDLCNVLGADRNGTFRDFFIKFMDIYVKSSPDSLKEINELMNVEVPETRKKRSHEERKESFSLRHMISQMIK